jgi:glyoxylase-like metal-dependent hydrolase (beta-lactamase superfamily II)
MAGSLSIDVFNSGYKPIPGGPGWDDSTPATWPAGTSTLISSDRDAVLVDALLTTSEGQRLAAWLRNTGKQPSVIFVTHGHADHFFGAWPVLDAFPGAQPGGHRAPRTLAALKRSGLGCLLKQVDCCGRRLDRGHPQGQSICGDCRVAGLSY